MSIDLPLSAMPRVSVIIPSSRRHDLLHACLQSLARHGPATIPYETIVVLSEAAPEAETRLRQTVTGIRVVSSPVKLGLVGAGNRGRALASGEYLILLHDDAEIEPGWMEALVETADAQPQAGAIGGKVLHPDGRLQFAGGILWRNGQGSPPWVGETPAPDAFRSLRAVDWCGSSSLLVRASVWDLIGGLDERFYPVYFVDIDLAMAVRKLGFVVIYQPSSRIRHHRSASSSPSFRDFLLYRNRRRLIKKWGAALQNHEPFENAPAAVERALAKAEMFANECRRRGAMRGEYSVSRAAFNPAEQDFRYARKSRALKRAYIRHRMLTTMLGKPRRYLRKLFTGKS